MNSPDYIVWIHFVLCICLAYLPTLLITLLNISYSFYEDRALPTVVTQIIRSDGNMQ